MNWPNRLTLVRIFLVPVFLLIISLHIPFGDYLAAAIFILAASTDGLDGYIARRKRQVTRFGQLMDPLADKLLITAALISLVELGRLPGWVAVLIIGREFAVTGLRAVAAAGGAVIAADRLGKIKTVTQIVAVIVLILQGLPYYHPRALVGNILLALAVIFTLWSGINYFQRNWHLLRD